MKLSSILPLAVALAATAAIAQDSANPSPAKNASLTISPNLLDRCPIGLQVDHGGLFVQKRTDYGPGLNDRMPLAGAVQRIHLTMTNPSAREIVEVQLTVHGYSDKGRTIMLASAGPDLAKKVTLTRDIQGNGHASSDLSLSNFTAVSSVDVDSLTYADGSSWKATAGGACSVAPNLWMLVSAAR